MEILNPSVVVEALRRLRRVQPDIFGANGHAFILNPRASVADVGNFERRNGIDLPRDYREFLTAIGNGGAGPYYGVFPLGHMDGTETELQPWGSGNGIVGIPSEPFLLREPWNDLAGMPDDGLADTDEAEYERQMDEFDAEYWKPSWMNGCLPICHMGCALRLWLVVAGDEAGHVWHDGRADLTGLKPVYLRDGSKATFSSWYMEWLNDALRAAEDRR